MNIGQLKQVYTIKDIIHFPINEDEFIANSRYFLFKYKNVTSVFRKNYSFYTDTINTCILNGSFVSNKTMCIHENDMKYIDKLLNKELNVEELLLIKYTQNSSISYDTGYFVEHLNLIKTRNNEIPIKNVLKIGFYNNIYKFLRSNVNEK